MILFKFNADSKLNDWRTVDDGVMGGQSHGDFKINTEGYGEYTGDISLKNNGGFSSLRYRFNTIESHQFTKFKIKIKGDGKTYQFRVKRTSDQRYSYVTTFTTTGNWQITEIPFNAMYAWFRGSKVDVPNFNGDQMEQIAFLIGNKKEEHFKLLIDSIRLE
ncbi:CIA30 family protein [uncultured Winogradskyella sp.]|uniref:CIA30 family protein n=1 Tax=uncultured Winogradskyella sp. TaxID=395353 RepID=UPI00262F103F|nr:CIA30 family protein [uncultured Winogradskyella sp.]